MVRPGLSESGSGGILDCLGIKGWYQRPVRQLRGVEDNASPKGYARLCADRALEIFNIKIAHFFGKLLHASSHFFPFLPQCSRHSFATKKELKKEIDSSLCFQESPRAPFQGGSRLAKEATQLLADGKSRMSTDSLWLRKQNYQTWLKSGIISVQSCHMLPCYAPEHRRPSRQQNLKHAEPELVKDKAKTGIGDSSGTWGMCGTRLQQCYETVWVDAPKILRETLHIVALFHMWAYLAYLAMTFCLCWSYYRFVKDTKLNWNCVCL